MKDPLNNAFSDAHFLCLEKGLPGNVENGGSTVKSIPWQHSMAWFPRGNPIAIPSFYPDIIPLRFHLKSPSIIHLLSISLHESMFADEILQFCCWYPNFWRNSPFLLKVHHQPRHCPQEKSEDIRGTIVVAVLSPRASLQSGVDLRCCAATSLECHQGEWEMSPQIIATLIRKMVLNND